MGFTSQAGYLGLRKYAGGATPPADLATKGRVFRLRSGTLGPSRELLVPDAEIGGNRDIADAYLGAVSWAGDLEMYLRLKEAGSFLEGVLGSVATTGTAPAAITHTITPTDGAMPTYWVEEQVGNGFENFNYRDAVMNTLHLEAEANGYLMATVGMIAKQQTSDITPTAGLQALVDTSPMIVGTNITVTYNGITLPAKSFNLDINNNFEDDDFRLGSLFLGDLTAKRREITAGFSLRPDDSALWKQAVYGSSTASTPTGTSTKQELVITMSSYEDIAGVTPTSKYQLTLTIPKAILQPFEVSPSGDDIIEHDVTLQAVRPAVGTAILTAVLKTDAATIA